MVLYNRFKFQKNKRQHKKKALDNPVVNSPEEMIYRQQNIDYLMNLKKQIEARHEKVSNIAFKRKLLEGVMKSNYETEMIRLKGEMHNPRIPETSLEHLQKRYDTLRELSDTIF